MGVFELWLPILLSAAAVFIASAIAHVALPHHKADWRRAEAEDGLMEALRAGGVGPGQYMFPYCAGPADLKNPEIKKKWETGPIGILTILPGQPNMGRNLGLSFVFYLVVSFFVAYLGTLAIDAGPFGEVFRFAGTAAIMAYALGSFPYSIWFGSSGPMVVRYLIDNIAYGLITGLIFAWLWPAAEMAAPAVPAI